MHLKYFKDNVFWWVTECKHNFFLLTRHRAPLSLFLFAFIGSLTEEWLDKLTLRDESEKGLLDREDAPEAGSSI